MYFNRRMCRRVALAFVVIIASTFSVHAQNIVGNGSFEQPVVPAGEPGWLSFPAGSTGIPSWLVTGPDGVDVHQREHATPWTVPDGKQALDLNGNNGSGVSQNLPTTAGQYRLRFYMSANLACAPPTVQLQVTLGGFVDHPTFNTAGKTFANMGWELHDYTVFLSGPAQLRFDSQTPSGGCGPAIDNVQVEAVTPPPPPPMFPLTTTTDSHGRVFSTPSGIDCPGDCSENYPQNTNVMLFAVPYPGYQFDHWTGDCSGSGTCQVVMTAARSVGAVFIQSRFNFDQLANNGSAPQCSPFMMTWGRETTPSNYDGIHVWYAQPTGSTLRVTLSVANFGKQSVNVIPIGSPLPTGPGPLVVDATGLCQPPTEFAFADGSYTFGGLSAGQIYAIVVRLEALNPTPCPSTAPSSSGRHYRLRVEGSNGIALDTPTVNLLEGGHVNWVVNHDGGPQLALRFTGSTITGVPGPLPTDPQHVEFVSPLGASTNVNFLIPPGDVSVSGLLPGDIGMWRVNSDVQEHHTIQKLTGIDTHLYLDAASCNRPPVAVDDTYHVAEDQTLNIGTPGVLVNDSDPDIPRQVLTVTLGISPSHGTLTLNSDGSFTYTPSPNFNGSDTFTYTVSDGSLTSSAAMVTIIVDPVNDAPVASGDSFSVDEDTTLTVANPGVLANDSDIDHDPLTAILVSGTSHGSLTLNANGSFTYTPVLNFNGSDSFTYKANDGRADSNVATVTIAVLPVNDPPVAGDDVYSMNQATALTVAAPGVLSNDSDVDSSTLTAVLVTPPSVGTVTLNSDGSFTYTPPLLYSGNVLFTYRVTDGALSDEATVMITINPVNVTVGRMTGGGSVFTAQNERVTHGMVLHCSLQATPNNLEINWGRGNNFHLTSLTRVQCVDDPAIGPAPPQAGFDTIDGEGTGTYNNVAGATVSFTFTDAGEPGRNDNATITVRDRNGVVVLTVSGRLNNGDQQAHNN